MPFPRGLGGLPFFTTRVCRPSRQHALHDTRQFFVFARQLARPRQSEPIEYAMKQARKRNQTLLYAVAEPSRSQLTRCRNYTISVLVGTIALSYASVPLYKTVRPPNTGNPR
jgi:hypothetical protein